MRKMDFGRHWSLLMPALPWLALPGEHCGLEKSHLGGSLIVVGIETKTILVSHEVYVYRTTLYVYLYARTYCQDTGVLFYHLL